MADSLGRLRGLLIVQPPSLSGADAALGFAVAPPEAVGEDPSVVSPPAPAACALEVPPTDEPTSLPPGALVPP